MDTYYINCIPHIEDNYQCRAVKTVIKLNVLSDSMSNFGTHSCSCGATGVRRRGQYLPLRFRNTPPIVSRDGWWMGCRGLQSASSSAIWGETMTV
ncbi:hypothetical protein E2C01_038007 [Portunus trituberculatus]|uniref:Uncharacterized protein n=1 Tax=Portunus trituberculatus TaxID=210409 RepID=A0A5B7FIQ9_PORTR|nr:hypothetical protein [Portunus trituberculatus]